MAVPVVEQPVRILVEALGDPVLLGKATQVVPLSTKRDQITARGAAVEAHRQLAETLPLQLLALAGLGLPTQ